MAAEEEQRHNRRPTRAQHQNSSGSSTMMWSTTRSSLGVLRRGTCRRQGRVFFSTMPGVQVTQTRGSSPSQRQHLLIKRHDDDDATALVDGLLHYTRQLIDESNKHHHVVAYSGGVDSSLVTALLQHAASSCDSQHHAVQAVFGISPAVSQEQIQQARHVASFLGVDLKEVYTTEGSDSTYIQNDGQACFACKTHLYTALQAVHQSTTTNDNVQLYNGTNQDDLGDATRVGLIAANNFSVQSPLQYTTKQNVRRAARHLNLPNWNAAAAPCLRSRLALGIQATKSHLSMIEQAERFVRQQLRTKIQDSTNIRVRMLTKQRAMIEVDANLLTELTLGEEEQAYFETLGFSSVSAREFRTGSVARRDTTTSKQTAALVPEEVDDNDDDTNSEQQVAVAVG